MTRKIIGAAFVSLDGVMQAPGAPDEDRSNGFAHGGWLAPVVDEAIGQEIDKLFAGPFALLLGRRTYDIFASYWPFQSMDIRSPRLSPSATSSSSRIRTCPWNGKAVSGLPISTRWAP